MPALALLAPLGSPELILLMLLPISLTAFWIWMLVECVTKEADTGNNKVVWVVVIATTHFIGATLYFFSRRPKRITELGR